MTPHIFPRQCTVVVADDRRGWTQIFGGKASEPETSRPVEENNFTYPVHLHLAPPLRVIRSEFCGVFGFKKLKN